MLLNGGIFKEFQVVGRAAKPVKNKKTDCAGQADPQPTDPDSTRFNTIIKKAPNQRRGCSRNTPGKPVKTHVTPAHIGRSQVGNVFADGGDKN